LINLQWLQKRGWLAELPTLEGGDPELLRRESLDRAFQAFQKAADAYDRRAYDRFVQEHADWLSDYAMYAALRDEFGGSNWQQWPEPLRDRHEAALTAARMRLFEGVERVQFEQYVFFAQWQELRRYAKSRGVILFGDMPIFVACDSADVWACRDYFDLDAEGQARVVAGVPPDYFSEVGQRWGNPHYRWDVMEADGFRWWVARLSSQLELYDWVRIDHFRGFEAYWEIPAAEPTAINGRWVKAPGEALLCALFDTVNGQGLPLVAENLGIITAEVEALRERFDIPGMLILQFAFDGGTDNPYLPVNHTENNVVYTGTHDNDTTLSWYESLSDEQREKCWQLLGGGERAMPDALIESAFSSPTRLAIFPMQDILGLGAGYRMNTPGTVGGANWRWRFEWSQLSPERSIWLSRQSRIHDRIP
jgi:4-alpha-glucanotransferase